MGEGSGFGKAILFNEHFVVYGIPAIVSAVGARTTAKVKKADKYKVIDNRPCTPGYKEKKAGQRNDSLARIFLEMGVDIKKTPLRIELGGDLIAMSGSGASAASCVAVARAINDEFGMGLGDERINEIAFEGEKGYHGTPSGVDNTASTFGGLTWFVKGNPPTFDPIRVKEPIRVVIGNTGIAADTAEVVADVRAAKESDPEKYGPIFRRAEELVNEARKTLERYDMEKLAGQMDEAHGLLREIGVSHEKLEEMIKIAKANGATGAKMTGTGRGGSMIALTLDEEVQEKVAKAFEGRGYKAVRTVVGAK